MLSYVKTSHSEPFSFIDSVANLTETRIEANADFSKDRIYKKFCKNPWPLIIESLAQAAGVHIRTIVNFQKKNINYYLSGIDNVDYSCLLNSLGFHILESQFTTKINNTYLYQCRSLNSSGKLMLECDIYISEI